jgi:hypothetical protein
MKRCSKCAEPATTFAYSGNPPQVSGAFCFVHSAVAGLSEPTPDWLVAVAQDAGLSANATFFVWSAIRARAKLCRTALGCCVAVWQEAEERFGEEAGDALREMGVLGGLEVSAAIRALVLAGVENLSDAGRLDDFVGLHAIGAFP